MLGKAAHVSKAEENMYLLQLLLIADLNRKKNALETALIFGGKYHTSVPALSQEDTESWTLHKWLKQVRDWIYRKFTSKCSHLLPYSKAPV